MNLVERANQQRLLRHLQGLLVKFQSGVPEMWMEAAERVRAWIGSYRDVDFFDEVEAHFGSPRHEEGEEEENTDDDDDDRSESLPRDRDGRPHDYDDDGGGHGVSHGADFSRSSSAAAAG